MRMFIKRAQYLLANKVGDYVQACYLPAAPDAEQILHDFGMTLLDLGLTICKLMEMLLKPMAAAPGKNA
jgi:hypothetical protein